MPIMHNSSRGRPEHSRKTLSLFNEIWNSGIRTHINHQPKITLDRAFLNKLRRKNVKGN